MSDSAAAKAYELWKAVEGSEESTGEWMEITQDRIMQTKPIMPQKRSLPAIEEFASVPAR